MTRTTARDREPTNEPTSGRPPSPPYTVVAFHAHPDDEALLTAGTMARAAAEGHRVVLVVATLGEAGLASSEMLADGSLGGRREAELERSASVLGVARTEWLGYQDSGWSAEADRPADAFSAADIDEAANRLADILREEEADVLLTYDPAGGYGHPDHVQVHHVGYRAAHLADTPVVLEATVDRRLLISALRFLRRIPGVALPDHTDPASFSASYSPSESITHRVNVRRFAKEKRAAMAAHASQASADTGVRTLAILLRLPGPVFRWALGREWFVERRRTPKRPPVDDIFATLR